jgi:hypothetical protein
MTPVMSFDHIDVDVTGALRPLLMATTIVCAPYGRRIDCVETPPAAGVLTDGAYDLAITVGQTPAGTTASARLINNPSGTDRCCTPAPSIRPCCRWGDVARRLLHLWRRRVLQRRGSASDVSTPARAPDRVVLAELRGSGGYVFTMERVSAGTSSAFGGTNLTHGRRVHAVQRRRRSI